jgi:DnaA family protein
MRQLALGVKLRAEAVFANFVPGGHAELLAALMGTGTNPVWISGARGSGKTHLLQATCAAHERAAYFPLGRDIGLPPEALQGFAASRVLCLDDVDAVAGDAAWELALFRCFNECADLGTRLVLAAGAAPRGIAWGLEDWASRAAACAVYQLHELDEAGRLEVLRLRARQRGLELPRETADYLLKRVPRDLNSLLDLLDALDEASLAAQRRLTIPFIRDALEKLASTRS